MGWAVLGRLVAPGKWLEELGQVGFSFFSVLFFFYLIFCHCLKIKTDSKTVPNILWIFLCC